MDRSRSESFACQKWALFTLALNQLLGCIYVFITTIYYDKILTFLLSPTSALIGCFISLAGVFGAYKEHYRLCLTYGTFMAIFTLLSFFAFIRLPILWFQTLISFGFTYLAFSFAKAIRRKRCDGYNQEAC